MRTRDTLLAVLLMELWHDSGLQNSLIQNNFCSRGGQQLFSSVTVVQPAPAGCVNSRQHPRRRFSSRTKNSSRAFYADFAPRGVRTTDFKTPIRSNFVTSVDTANICSENVVDRYEKSALVHFRTLVTLRRVRVRVWE